ncbi:MAG: AraC family transcriptional regulator [Lewinellaceae bacterium]|nr:AraC family transcriptional regulator [Lewinellaceae bacterium]
MKYLAADPAPCLQPFILRYYQINGYTSEHQPYREFTFPNGFTSMVLHFEEPIQVSNVGYDGRHIPRSYIFGKYTKPVFVNHAFGAADVFGVIFHPGRFHLFLSLPQQELTNQLLDVADGFGEEMPDVLDRMYHNPSFQARINILERFFVKKLHYKDFRLDVVDAVVNHIFQDAGKTKVYQLARKFGLSRQHLNRLFLPRLGLNVKEYSRTIRFNFALRAILSGGCADLLQAAVDFGYHDESHLIKDFHDFTKGRPSEFLGEDNELARFLMPE